METLSKDMLFEILHYLSDQDLFNSCQVDKMFSELCKDDQFWEARAKLKYPNEVAELKKVSQPRVNNTYKTLYHWAPILFLKKFFPKQLGQKSLEEIYHLQKLNLSDNKLISIPMEIGKLINLQELNLSRNQLTSIPPELGNLKTLESSFRS